MVQGFEDHYPVETADLSDEETSSDEAVAEDEGEVVEDAVENEEPNELEELRKEFQASSAETRRLVQQLTTAVGRAQSLADRAKAEPDPQVNAQLGAVTELLGTLVSGLDETIMDPALKQRILAAQAASAEASRQAELEAKLAAMVEERVKEVQPAAVPDEVQQRVLSFQQSIEDEITSFGLDPDDDLFDWQGEASKLLREQGESATRAYFRTKIREGLQGAGADQRREERRAAAGQGSPRGSGVGTEVDVLSDPKKGLDDKIEELRRMGAIRS